MSLDPISLGNARKWIELASYGVDIWNTWAADELKRDITSRKEIDLSGMEIEISDWGGFIFPCKTNFNNSIFKRSAHFFKAIFHDYAGFSNVHFTDSSFGNVIFKGRADFSGSYFSDYCSFHYAEFQSDAFFYTSYFKGETYFVNAKFSDEVRLSAITFEKKVSFLDATFLSNVNFKSTKFRGPANFELAKFSGLILFDEANFTQPPDLTSIAYKHAPSFWGVHFAFYKTSPEYLYRRLKKFAVAAQDHRSELNLFALETRARRNQLTLLRPKDWLEIILNRAYQMTSDYGRSIARPIISLLITFVFFAYRFSLVFGIAKWPWKWPKISWITSLVNLIPFAGMSANAKQVIEKSYFPPSGTTINDNYLIALYKISILENLVSIILSFLLVQGLRNMFKLK